MAKQQKIEVPVTGTLFVVPTKDGRFSGTINGKEIGVSKHQDYFEYHFKLGNLKNLRESGVARFAYGTARGKIERVADLPAVKRRQRKTVATSAAMTAAPTQPEVIKRVIVDLKM